MSIKTIVYFSLLLSAAVLGAKEPVYWENTGKMNEEESLFLRRIADFWEEGEYPIVKNQIEEFLKTFPQSPFADSLSAALGDLLLREKNYAGALNYYSKITAPDLLQQISLNRMQCLYHLEWYATLADECEALLQEVSNENFKLKTTYYLAIALYHQCLNAQKEKEVSIQLAKRAEPYFQTLLESELSDETAQAFAHLCCILKDFPKASQIYLELAHNNPDIEEEMSFQAALIQAEFDPERAAQTFLSIGEKNGAKSKEAAYNLMVLLFETKQYEELLNRAGFFLDKIPSEKQTIAYFFLGRSDLALKRYSEAALKLKNCLDKISFDQMEPAAISLIEATFQANDLSGIDLALAKLAEIDSHHPEIAKGFFSRALLLKKLGNLEEAAGQLERLLTLFPETSFRAQTLFELAHLAYQGEDWTVCHNYAKTFIGEFPQSELAPFAWRYLASASNCMALDKEGQQLLILDIEALLKQEDLFSERERDDWQFFLSKGYFDLGNFEKSIECLEQLIQKGSEFSQKGNSHLLLALSYRDGKGDLSSFCATAKKAIDLGCEFIELGSLHSSLFNAYLTLAKETPELLSRAADHLYQAFEQKAPILPENLIWLTEYYDEKFDNVILAERTIAIYHDLLNHPEVEKDAILYKLAKLYSLVGKTENQIALLNQLLEEPSETYEKEAQFLLAEGYVASGHREMAASLYDLIAKTNPPTRSEISAKAHLQRARLRLDGLSKGPSIQDSEVIETLAAFKDLMLQKTLSNEPVHLEAAFEYANLKKQLEGHSLEKEIELWKKIKGDFEQEGDLLSKDYHKAKERFPSKEKIYLGYLQLLEAEILLSYAKDPLKISERKELQAKGKDLLLEIIKEKAHPALIGRAHSRLQATDGDFSKN